MLTNSARIGGKRKIGEKKHEGPNGHTIRDTNSSGSVNGDSYTGWYMPELDPDGRETTFLDPGTGDYVPAANTELFQPDVQFGSMTKGQYTTATIDGLTVPMEMAVLALTHGSGDPHDLAFGLLRFSAAMSVPRFAGYSLKFGNGDVQFAGYDRSAAIGRMEGGETLVRNWLIEEAWAMSGLMPMDDARASGDEQLHGSGPSVDADNFFQPGMCELLWQLPEPDASSGYVIDTNETPRDHQFGNWYTIHYMEAVAADWSLTGHTSPLRYGSMGISGGGQFPPHKGRGHSYGIASDIRLFGLNGTTVDPVHVYDDPNYDRSQSEDLIAHLIRDDRVARVEFGDKTYKNKSPKYKFDHSTTHRNHIHVVWNTPCHKPVL